MGRKIQVAVAATATAAAASLALFGAGSASAAEVLDAHCGDPTVPAGSSIGNNRVGQTFTALNTGQLTSATVNVEKEGSDEPFSMQIRPLDGLGVPEESAASAIATEAVPAPASSGFVPLTGNFSTPASVVAGDQYALVLERTPDAFGWGIAGQDVCDGGNMWITNPVPVWDENCTPDMPPVCFDSAFSVRVELPPTPPPSTGPTAAPTAAPTGERAAALKKCKKTAKKKHWSKKQLKKCKKKAKKLPV